jgi:hypothetical protein
VRSGGYAVGFSITNQHFGDARPTMFADLIAGTKVVADVPRMGRLFRLRDVAAPSRVETDQLKQLCKVPKDWHGGCSAPHTAEGEPR